MKVVHLAGNAIRLGDRIIQRCFICGEKLCDNLNVAIPVNQDGSDPSFATFGVGAWVENEGNRMSVIGESESPQMDSSEIPDGCCVDLVEN